MYYTLIVYLPDKAAEDEDEREYFINNKYNNQIFYSILINTRAAGVSTADI
jgi:hypothetical protein